MCGNKISYLWYWLHETRSTICRAVPPRLGTVGIYVFLFRLHSQWCRNIFYTRCYFLNFYNSTPTVYTSYTKMAIDIEAAKGCLWIMLSAQKRYKEFQGIAFLPNGDDHKKEVAVQIIYLLAEWNVWNVRFRHLRRIQRHTRTSQAANMSAELQKQCQRKSTGHRLMVGL